MDPSNLDQDTLSEKAQIPAQIGYQSYLPLLSKKRRKKSVY